MGQAAGTEEPKRRNRSEGNQGGGVHKTWSQLDDEVKVRRRQSCSLRHGKMPTPHTKGKKGRQDEGRLNGVRCGVRSSKQSCREAAGDMGEKSWGWGCRLRVCMGESSPERQKLELRRTRERAQCSNFPPWTYIPIPLEASINFQDGNLGFPVALLLSQRDSDFSKIERGPNCNSEFFTCKRRNPA